MESQDKSRVIFQAEIQTPIFLLNWAPAAVHAAPGTTVAADRAVAAVPLAVVQLSGHPAAAAPAALRRHRRRRICPLLVQPGPERGRRPPGRRMRTLPLPLLPPPEGAREAEEALRLHLGPRATETQEGEGRRRQQRVGEETVEVCERCLHLLRGSLFDFNYSPWL